MHEYSIVQALIDEVEREVRARRAAAVHRVIVRIGALSGVDAGLVASAYDLSREGTVCGAAELEIEREEAVWTCPACDLPIARGEILRCPACGEPASLRGGDEIVLRSIELEVP